VEPESADDAGEAVRGAPLIFISDASAEAERLSSALRAHGYLVMDVPLSLLSGRVAVQRPLLLLCDADAEGSAEVLARIDEAERDASIAVILLGDRDGALARLGTTRIAAAFARPVNVQELLGTVARIVGPGETGSAASLSPSARGGKIATSSRPPSRASVSPASVRPLERRDSVSPAIPTLPPDLDGEGGTAAPREPGDSPTVELSHDIVQVLADAEARLRDGVPAPPTGSDEHGPEMNAEAPLSPDVLAALEEPLDDEDLVSDGTPMPPQDATGMLTGSKVGVRGYTQTGGAPHLTIPGSDGTGATSFDQPIAPASVTTGVVAPFGEPDEDSKIARQQASTPRPPKPGAEDLVAGASVEPPPPRKSAPPITATDHPIPEPPLSIGTAVLPASLRGFTSEPPIAGDRSALQPRIILNFDSEPPNSSGPPSTKPPASRQEHPPARFRREEELPSDVTIRPGPEALESDRPAGPPTEQPGRRASEPPGSLRLEHPNRKGSDRPGARTEPPVKRESDRPRPQAEPESAPNFPTALRAGDAVALLATAIGARYSGSLAIEVDEGIRRVVFRDGDFVTVTSGVHGESLVAFLVGRGDLPAEAARQAHKLPPFGRRAGAALIAHGFLAQDALWPVLRGHAEWLVGRILGIERGSVHPEEVGRLGDEPAVFGGATGAEVLVEVTRRVVPSDEAIGRLGGSSACFVPGPARALLGECALSPMDAERVQTVEGKSVQEVLEASPDASFAAVLHALVALGVLRVEAARAAPVVAAKKPVRDEIDEAALRTRILARKALVDEGDYFAVLGVSRDATSYDIRRAYTDLRRELEPSRVLTPSTADLGDTVDEIVGVLEEAYQILSDQRRRERYRRAIEASP